ncbi:MAG: hypothetical protein P8Y03_28975 [Anaerolineales bacterium]|jgi:putative transposase
MSNKPAPLLHGGYYHVYNRGINREGIFIEERNYRYFLRLYGRYVVPFVDTFAYCLMGNHFHFAVRVKTIEELSELSMARKPGGSLRSPSQQIGNMLNAYARAFNKTYNRSGSLFQQRLGRKEIATDGCFAQLVAYIHWNPQKHGFTQDFRQWEYSSYRATISNKPTFIQRDEVLAWFEGRKGFIDFHQQEIEEEDLIKFLQEGFE